MYKLNRPSWRTDERNYYIYLTQTKRPADVSFCTPHVEGNGLSWCYRETFNSVSLKTNHRPLSHYLRWIGACSSSQFRSSILTISLPSASASVESVRRRFITLDLLVFLRFGCYAYGYKVDKCLIWRIFTHFHGRDRHLQINSSFPVSPISVSSICVQLGIGRCSYIPTRKLLDLWYVFVFLVGLKNGFRWGACSSFPLSRTVFKLVHTTSNVVVQ